MQTERARGGEPTCSCLKIIKTAYYLYVETVKKTRHQGSETRHGFDSESLKLKIAFAHEHPLSDISLLVAFRHFLYNLDLNL